MLVLLSGAYSFSIILCNREFFVEMTIVASLNSHNFSVQLASFFLLNSSDNDTKNGEKEEKNRCAAGRTVKVKTCCEALTFDKVGREKGLK